MKLALIPCIRICDAVLQMVLQNNLCRTVQGGAYRSQLHQYIRTVPAALNHALYRLQMPDCPGKAVYNGLGLGMTVAVLVAMFMYMLMLMLVLMAHIVCLMHTLASGK